jgi:hypothetical protein
MRLQVAAGALAPEAQTRGEGHPKAHRLGRRIFTQSLPERASKPHQALHELYQDRLKLYQREPSPTDSSRSRSAGCDQEARVKLERQDAAEKR